MRKKSRVLVTGGAGTVGSELVDRLIDQDKIVCVFDNNEDGLFKLHQRYSNNAKLNNLRIFLGDVRDYVRVFRAMEGVHDVYHCAALKHVYLSEYNPFDLIKTNIDGLANIINAAINQRVQKVVFTSSDKAVNPTSAMGASKLLGEKLILAANSQIGSEVTKFSCVRFGNVLNSNGSVLKIFESQLSKNLPLTITSTAMTRYFITMGDAIDLCLFANQHMLGGEIFISNMGAADILSLAKAYCKGQDFSYEVIGEKAGEKLYEELITDVELKRTVEFGKNYVVLPEVSYLDNLNRNIPYAQQYGACKKVSKIMRSDKDLIDFATLLTLVRKI